MLKSTVLCFNLSKEKLRQLSACAKEVEATAIVVPQPDFSQTVGALIGVLPRSNEICFAPFRQSMIIMSSFDNNKMDTFLALLKQKQVRLPYKAMVTPTNVMWRCDALAAELVKEHEQIKKTGNKQ